MLLKSFSRRSVYTGSVGKVLANFAPIEAIDRPSIFSKSGLIERYFRMKNYFKNLLGIYFIQRNLPAFSQKDFIKESALTYAKFLDSFYKSDISSLRLITSPSLYSELSSKIKKLGPTALAHNFQIDMKSPPTIIQILPVKIQTPHTIEIYQITMKIEYFVQDKKYIDYVVFERSSSSSETSWKICGKVFPNNDYFLS